MSEAWEKAVEAGAVQLCWGPDGTSMEEVPSAVAGRFRTMSLDVLRAAFPILAEELFQQAEEAWEVGGGSKFILTALRARIEQMKEMKE